MTKNKYDGCWVTVDEWTGTSKKNGLVCALIWKGKAFLIYEKLPPRDTTISLPDYKGWIDKGLWKRYDPSKKETG